MIRQSMFAAVAVAALAGAAFAAEPIEGTWRTESGATAEITDCGGAYCITLTSGEHAGKQIGRVSGSNGTYTGTVTDPADDKTYSGSASVSGSTMKLKGCALKIFCKTQTWSRL